MLPVVDVHVVAFCSLAGHPAASQSVGRDRCCCCRCARCRYCCRCCCCCCRCCSTDPRLDSTKHGRRCPGVRPFVHPLVVRRCYDAYPARRLGARDVSRTILHETQQSIVDEGILSKYRIKSGFRADKFSRGSRSDLSRVVALGSCQFRWIRWIDRWTIGWAKGKDRWQSTANKTNDEPSFLDTRSPVDGPDDDDDNNSSTTSATSFYVGFRTLI